jgi:hypothetical protein
MESTIGDDPTGQQEFVSDNSVISVRLSDGPEKEEPGIIAIRLSDGPEKEEPGIIAIRLSDGLGNRLFQLAALLGYAERWKKKPTLFPSQIHPCNHADALEAHQLFPHLHLTWDVSGWTTIGELAKDYASYKPFPHPNPHPTSDVGPILLKGFFQTERYFPSQGIKLSFESVLGEDRMSVLEKHYRDATWWIHLRLGDYMVLPHYDIDLPAYLRTVLPHIPHSEEVILYSDSPRPALELVQGIAPELSIVCAASNLTPIETLYCMSLASGGCVCTNSTFSWWGAYSSAARVQRRPIYFPGRWNRLPHTTADIYPSWGIRVDY